MTNNKLTAIGYTMINNSALTALLGKKQDGTTPSVNEDDIPIENRNLPCIVYYQINDGFYNEAIDQEQFIIQVIASLTADIMNIKYKLDNIFKDKTITYNSVNYRTEKISGVVNRDEDAASYAMTITVKQLQGV